MSIPAETSLLQNEVQILNAKPCKQLTGPGGDSVLGLDIADLIIALSFHCTRWRFALPMAKSHWNGALRSANMHKSCTHGHVSWKRWREEKLVAAPWTSSRQFSHMLWLKVHSRQLLRACLLGSKRKLPPSACQVWQTPLQSAVQGACSSLAPCTSVIRVVCQALQPTAFIVHQVRAAVAEDAVAAYTSATDGTWKLAWTLQEVQAHITDHDLQLSCIYSVLSPPLLLSKSRASWHIPQAIKRWQDHRHRGPPRGS